MPAQTGRKVTRNSRTPTATGALSVGGPPPPGSGSTALAAVQVTVRGAVRQEERRAVRWAMHSVALVVNGSGVGTPSHVRTTAAIEPTPTLRPRTCPRYCVSPILADPDENNCAEQMHNGHPLGRIRALDQSALVRSAGCSCCDWPELRRLQTDDDHSRIVRTVDI